MEASFLSYLQVAVRGIFVISFKKNQELQIVVCSGRKDAEIDGTWHKRVT
jgi:hypothetical protein